MPLIFALIRIGDRPNTLKGLAMAGSGAKRGALIALDQMDGGQLTPDVVTPFLEPTDPLMHETALWVIAHHGEWGQAMLDFFRQWLARGDMDDARRDELKLQLLAFVKDTAVQELIATALADSRTPLETRLLLLEVMAQAGIAKLPARLDRPIATGVGKWQRAGRPSGGGHAARHSARQATPRVAHRLANQFRRDRETVCGHSTVGKLLRALDGHDSLPAGQLPTLFTPSRTTARSCSSTANWSSTTAAHTPCARGRAGSS